MYCLTYSSERALTFLLLHVTCYKHQTFGVCPRGAVISGAAVQIVVISQIRTNNYDVAA